VAPTLVFDIETCPDLAGIRLVHELPSSLSDAAVLDWYSQRRRSQTGSDFAAHTLQKVVAIGCALRDESTFRVWSLGEPDDPEHELIRRFFDGITRYVPQLVSWNGSGFDLPVLHHRALIHGVPAAKYWDWGDDDKEFRYNNYLGRFHTRHLDLMDVLACYQTRACAGLDTMAKLCGFPGKIGMAGGDVHAAVCAGRIVDVRSYCETDAMNTYLIYQRFRLMRGEVNGDEYASEIALAREKIAASGARHWKEFLAAWK
jgi:predicted PolB exonuclease-like 3'-5' exonuclease